MGRKLFDDNEESEGEEVTFGRSSEYSRKYDVLRRKEELLKLKNKYGESFKEDDESSSSEDIDDVTFSEKFEKDFFKTLACLKNKDPRIYDSTTRFFDPNNEVTAKSTTKNKEKPVKIRDYNREMILNENISDEEDENFKPPPSPTYVQEQAEIKKSFQTFIAEEDDAENNIGGLFSKKKKSAKEEEEDEQNYRNWLNGERKHLNDEDENDLKPLKDYWSNPKLDENEVFLRDYVLNQRFKEKTDSGRIPSYEEIINDEDDVSEDEKILGQQTEFEHKFNFRFEEPDQDFIKRYPRTLEHSMRRKDDKRSKKRAEIKERKAEEKKRKKEEIAQLKALKLKEIQEKISQLKEITGNDQLAFDPNELDDDFDPEAHDRKMQELFNEEYYNDEVDAKKPEFPELDEELDIENWDNWTNEHNNVKNDYEPHCEDEDFNMDCDYNPNAITKKSLLENLKETVEGPKRKRKRKNKLADSLAREKPVFDPEKLKMSFSQYLDEYYKLDCEDVIGDMPCRYKYRQVPACDYGLTLEEILMADDNELNRWYSLKKTLQYRPDHLQYNDQHIYSKKAANINLKRKYLPSLFRNNEEDLNEEPQEGGSNENSTKSKNKKKKKKKKKSQNRNVDMNESDSSPQKVQNDPKDNNAENNKIEGNSNNNNAQFLTKSIKKNKKKACNERLAIIENNNGIDILPDDKLSKKKSKKSKNKDNEHKKNKNVQNSIQDEKVYLSIEEPPKKKFKHKKDTKEAEQNGQAELKDVQKKINKESGSDERKKKKNKKKFNGGKIEKNKQGNMASSLTDERLKAYGLNPKKYRSFVKFKKF